MRVFQRDGVSSRVGHLHVADAGRRHVAYDVDGDAPAADQWPSVEVPRDPRRGRRAVRQLHDDRLAFLERQRLVNLFRRELRSSCRQTRLGENLRSPKQ